MTFPLFFSLLNLAHFGPGHSEHNTFIIMEETLKDKPDRDYGVTPFKSLETGCQ